MGKKPFWTNSMILVAVVGVTTSVTIQYLRERKVENQSTQGFNELSASVQHMSEEERGELNKITDECKEILFSKFTAQEAERAKYLTERFAKGIIIYAETSEYSNLVKKAKESFTSDEMSKYKRFEELGLKLSKYKKT